MARDYKTRPRRAATKKTKSKKERRFFSLNFFIGLATGLMIAWLIHLFLFSEMPLPTLPASSSKTTPSSSSKEPKRASTPSKKGTSPTASRPSEKKRSRPETESERPRFEFYTILPDREMIIPDEEIGTRAAQTRSDLQAEKRADTPPDRPASTTTATPRSTSTPSSTAPARSEQQYIIQAASFQNFADADRLKARIALLGIVASIQTVTIKEGEEWHRVRIGPVSSTEEVNRLRNRLAEHKIKALVIRQKS
jgi:cell division protein FtsN